MRFKFSVSRLLNHFFISCPSSHTKSRNLQTANNKLFCVAIQINQMLAVMCVRTALCSVHKYTWVCRSSRTYLRRFRANEIWSSGKEYFILASQIASASYFLMMLFKIWRMCTRRFFSPSRFTSSPLLPYIHAANSFHLTSKTWN